MKRYRVQVSRCYSHTGIVSVVATTKKEAEKKALAEIDNTELDLDCLVKGTDEAVCIQEGEQILNEEDLQT